MDGGRYAESKPEQERAAGRARSAARNTRLRLERIERLLVPRAAMTFVFLASAHTANPGKVIEAEGR
jgi:hypothetical protein